MNKYLLAAGLTLGAMTGMAQEDILGDPPQGIPIRDKYSDQFRTFYPDQENDTTIISAETVSFQEKYDAVLKANPKFAKQHGFDDTPCIEGEYERLQNGDPIPLFDRGRTTFNTPTKSIPDTADSYSERYTIVIDNFPAHAECDTGCIELLYYNLTNPIEGVKDELDE